jgi:hypothetical protein
VTPTARIKTLQSAIARIERVSTGGYESLELNVALHALYRLLEAAREDEAAALPQQEALAL